MIKAKGKFIDKALLKKVLELKDIAIPIRTHSRNCLIVKDFIGRMFEVHNGKRYIKVYITKEMVDKKHKLGMYAPTKKPVIHSGHRKESGKLGTKKAK